MFQELLGNFIDTEKVTHETIQNTLLRICEENQCSFKDIFITIKPTDENCNMRFDIFRYVDGKPSFVRKIELSEILNK